MVQLKPPFVLFWEIPNQPIFIDKTLKPNQSLLLDDPINHYYLNSKPPSTLKFFNSIAVGRYESIWRCKQLLQHGFVGDKSSSKVRKDINELIDESMNKNIWNSYCFCFAEEGCQGITQGRQDLLPAWRTFEV